MKTPDEFIHAVNDRRAERSWKSERRKPPVVIVTIVLATLMLAAGGNGVLQLARALGRIVQGEVSILAWVAAFVRALSMAVLAAATLFACLKRPRWGRVVSVAFAIVFSAFAGYVLASPDPHPTFQIAPGAEQAGAYAGYAMMAFGILVYAWAMLWGAKAKAYFTADCH